MDTLEFTVRIPVRTVIGCGQLFQRQGGDPKKIDDITQLIEGTLTSLMPWFEQMKWIAPVDDESAWYAEIFGRRLHENEPEVPPPCRTT